MDIFYQIKYILKDYIALFIVYKAMLFLLFTDLQWGKKCEGEAGWAESAGMARARIASVYIVAIIAF